MLLRCQYYPEIYRFDAVPNQILVMFLYRNIKIHPTIHVEFQRTPNDQKEKKKNRTYKRRAKLEISHLLISNHTVKLQQSKQYSTGMETDIRIRGSELSLEIISYICDQLRRQLRSQHGCQDHSVEGRIVFSTNDSETTGQTSAK